MKKNTFIYVNGIDKPVKWAGSGKLNKMKIPKPTFVTIHKKRLKHNEGVQ